MTPLFIAEIGNNHNGDLALATEMADAAIAAGADFVKFQVYDIARFIAPANAYYDDLAAESLSFDDFRALKDHVEAKGGRFLATPFDRPSLRLLDELGCATIKVSSGDVDNLDLLGAACDLGKRIILSVGGAALGEIDATVAFLKDRGADFTLLHCVLAYPADFTELNLRFIPTLAARYGVPVGYSDHSPGVEAAVAAVALGAGIIEKHFTTDRALPGGDNEMSILPEELARMRRECTHVALALGMPERLPSATEQAIRKLVRRTYHATRDLGAGERVGDDDVELLRPSQSGIGFHAAERGGLVGATLGRAVPRGHVVAKEDVHG